MANKSVITSVITSVSAGISTSNRTSVSANVSAGNKIREGKSRWISIDVDGGIYLAAGRNGGDKGYLCAW